MLLTWLGVGDEDEQQRKGECLFLTLAHTAFRAHPAHVLYSLVKKLPTGLFGLQQERPILLHTFLFILRTAALPMLVLEFILYELPELFFKSKVTKVSRIFIQIIDPGAALIGVVATIWHGSQIASKACIISYIICAAIVVSNRKKHFANIPR
jgi:hypothetical protein